MHTKKNYSIIGISSAKTTSLMFQMFVYILLCLELLSLIKTQVICLLLKLLIVLIDTNWILCHNLQGVSHLVGTGEKNK